MRLADFLDAEHDAILQEWETFARSLQPADSNLDVSALRDHARQILEAAARDLRTYQSPAEQAIKARGDAAVLPTGHVTAAETHGSTRAALGFTVQQLVAEYRLLRACVLRLWADKHTPGAYTIRDMTRFNEAIDQAVAESVEVFVRQTERWRSTFLAVLGHDLRAPLNAMVLTAHVLAQLPPERPSTDITARLLRGAERMTQLLDDLLDYNRASLHLGISIRRERMLLAKACEDELELQRAAWPSSTINLEVRGSTRGVWDASRLRQVLANLVSNAAKYGEMHQPILVRLTGGTESVELAVENAGPTISAAKAQSLFEPLLRAAHGDAQAERTSMGLGLYIVRQISRAHGGEVRLSSDTERTVFTVQLPRVSLSTAPA